MGDDRKQQEIIKLDQILKLLFRMSKKVTIDLLNGLFEEEFSSDEVSVEYGNSEFIKDDLDRIIGDVFINIHKGTYLYHYHIEFQTTNDNSMVIRMFQYGFEKALELNNAAGQEEIRLDFPKQLVIFIEENENIADELSLVVVLPDGKEVRYKIPTMKYWQYSAEDLKNKKLYALLPLQVFKLRKRIAAIYNSNREHKEKAQLINKEFNILLDVIRNTIDTIRDINNSEEILASDLEKILRVITNISEYLYNKYGEYAKTGEEVYRMVKTLYDPAVEERGIIKGKIEDILELLEDLGSIPAELEEKIKKQQDPALLTKWLKMAARVNSIEEFKEKIQ
jgi:hypothetical protein